MLDITGIDSCRLCCVVVVRQELRVVEKKMLGYDIFEDEDAS